MLKIRGLEVFYGPIRAVRGIDLDIAAGEIVALIGANGAGKTATVRAIAGLTPYNGEVSLEGRRLQPNSAEFNLRAGISLVPEGRGILGRMSVDENLLMGIYCRSDHAAALADIGHMFERFPILKERRHSMASLLSGGEQQMLAIARALLSRPRLLLLDEPSLGLAPLLAKQIFKAIRTLNEQDGLSVFLVEQNAFHALKLAHRGYVMVNGNITLSGTGEELLKRPEVRAAYLEGGH